jgi:hypothetical protein
MPAGVSDLAVGGYASVPEPGLTGLLLFASAALLGTTRLRRRGSRRR